MFPSHVTHAKPLLIYSHRFCLAYGFHFEKMNFFWQALYDLAKEMDFSLITDLFKHLTR